VSLNSNIDIWITLAREKYPTLPEDELKRLGMTAAAVWYADGDTDLANLFDQYIMLKTLKGNSNGT
jgi:hypothetical protein